jgi:DNA polymerase-1
MGWQHAIVQPGMELPDLDESPVMSLDVETKPRPEFAKRKKAGLDPHHAEILGLCVGVPGRSWYLPLRHRAPGSEHYNLDPANTMQWLRATVKLKKCIVNHNIKFDAKHLKVNGGDAANNVDLLRDAPEADLWDTMLAAQLIDERWPTHAMKPICEAALGIPAVEATLLKRYTAAMGQKKDYLDYSVVPVDLMGKYGNKDAELPLRLAAWEQPQLARQGLDRSMALETRTLQTLIKCETTGFRVDVPRLLVDSLKVSQQALKLEEDLHKEAGVSFNCNSAEELADVVSTVFEIPVKKRYDPKSRSMKAKFDDLVLQEYALDHPARAPFFFKVRMVRRLYHLLNSFIESYLHHRVGDLIYPNFNQLSPKSGTRMTSHDPNVQQVSSVKEWTLPDNLALPDQVVNRDGERCWLAPGARQYFIPRAGHSLLLFDQSQIEYRLFAHYAGNERMLTAYRDDPNVDLHEWMRVEILNSLIKRRPAKNVHFGIVYGMGKTKTVKSMQVSGANITLAEGEGILDTYHAKVPEVKILTRGVSDALKARGYVCSILGGRRRIAQNWEKSKDEWDEDDEKDKGLRPYQALNAICQRSAMDVLKTTMNQADAAGFTTLTPIHDELIFEPPVELVEDWARRLKPALEQFVRDDGAPWLKVPIYVQGKYAPTRWSEAEDVEFE